MSFEKVCLLFSILCLCAYIGYIYYLRKFGIRTVATLIRLEIIPNANTQAFPLLEYNHEGVIYQSVADNELLTMFQNRLDIWNDLKSGEPIPIIVHPTKPKSIYVYSHRPISMKKLIANVWENVRESIVGTWEGKK